MRSPLHEQRILHEFDTTAHVARSPLRDLLVLMRDKFCAQLFFWFYQIPAPIAAADIHADAAALSQPKAVGECRMCASA